MEDSIEFTLNSPLTESDWDKITDPEFEKTDRITFRTKSGKTVEFAKVSEEFEWCHDCKEYDAERHCCPRWNKVIRNTVEEVEKMKQIWLEKDGTLQVLTDENLDDVKRVLVTQKGSIYGSLFYPDFEADMKGDNNGTD